MVLSMPIIILAGLGWIFFIIMLLFWLRGQNERSQLIRNETEATTKLAAHLETELKIAEIAAYAAEAQKSSLIEASTAQIGSELAVSQSKTDTMLTRTEERFTAGIKPIAETLKSMQEQVVQLEKNRISEIGRLDQQLAQLGQMQAGLQVETQNLAGVMKSSQSRGRWGELQLRRVVELSGMEHYCDFAEQPTIDMNQQRPDMIVHIPGHRQVVVDAKAPTEALLRSHAAQNETERRKALQEHARDVRQHIKTLAKRDYANKVSESVNFTAMFLPTDSFLAAALEADPEIIEYSIKNQVVIVTPMTLIGLLRVVSLDHQHHHMTENAQKVQELGGQMYERLIKVSENMDQLGKHFNQAHTSYNSMVGSFESRALVTAREMRMLGAADKQAELKTPRRVEVDIRRLTVSADSTS